MPLSQLALFPIGTILLFLIVGRIRISANETLVARQKPNLVVPKFLSGFVLGGLMLILIIAFAEKQFLVSLSPLPEFFGLNSYIH